MLEGGARKALLRGSMVGRGVFCTEGYSSLKTEGGQIFAERLVCSLYDGARKALLCGRGQGLGERVRGVFVPRDIQA